MIFPHSFFEDEIRSDYLVPSMIKRTWAAQMEILDDLDEACRKAGLEYYAEWGTLLGTVRHGGFIPWDDDMDICMKRCDYAYLIDNVSTLLPENYSIVSFRSNRSFRQMLCRLVSSDHYRFDPEYMHKYSGLPIALGIDIFPLDYLTDDEEYEAEREERVRLVYEAAEEISVYDTPVSALYERLGQIEKRCRVTIDRSGDVLIQLRLLLEKLFGEVEEKDAKYITLYPIWLDNHGFKFPVTYYSPGIRLPFETMTIPVPACYDAVLSEKYGSSYMKQVRSGGAHDYPYYEKHVNVLRENFGFEWPAYRFDPKDLPKHELGSASGDGHGKRALFVTYDPKAFENMRPAVAAYEKNGYDVTVLPISKYDIAPDMTGIVPAPSDVPDEHYTCGCANVSRDPGIISSHPDVIVTNYPYDEYNLITTVDKAFYSVSLANSCDRLVYVPPFEPDHFTEGDERSKKLMPLYVCTKLAAVCDGILLRSKEMKAGYVDCLCSFSGEEYRDTWEKKITVLEKSAPEEGIRPSGKKKIMFYIGIAGFAQYGEKMTDKIRSSMSVFDKNSDGTDVVITFQDDLCDNLKRLYPDLYEQFVSLNLIENGKETDIHTIDAYYGEASVYATQFLDMHRPVMIMNIEH